MTSPRLTTPNFPNKHLPAPADVIGREMHWSWDPELACCPSGPSRNRSGKRPLDVFEKRPGTSVLNIPSPVSPHSRWKEDFVRNPILDSNEWRNKRQRGGSTDFLTQTTSQNSNEYQVGCGDHDIMESQPFQTSRFHYGSPRRKEQQIVRHGHRHPHLKRALRTNSHPADDVKNVCPQHFTGGTANQKHPRLKPDSDERFSYESRISCSRNPRSSAYSSPLNSSPTRREWLSEISTNADSKLRTSREEIHHRSASTSRLEEQFRSIPNVSSLNSVDCDNWRSWCFGHVASPFPAEHRRAGSTPAPDPARATQHSSHNDVGNQRTKWDVPDSSTSYSDERDQNHFSTARSGREFESAVQLRAVDLKKNLHQAVRSDDTVAPHNENLCHVVRQNMYFDKQHSARSERNLSESSNLTRRHRLEPQAAMSHEYFTPAATEHRTSSETFSAAVAFWNRVGKRCCRAVKLWKYITSLERNLRLLESKMKCDTTPAASSSPSGITSFFIAATCPLRQTSSPSAYISGCAVDGLILLVLASVKKFSQRVDSPITAMAQGLLSHSVYRLQAIKLAIESSTSSTSVDSGYRVLYDLLDCLHTPVDLLGYNGSLRNSGNPTNTKVLKIHSVPCIGECSHFPDFCNVASNIQHFIHNTVVTPAYQKIFMLEIRWISHLAFSVDLSAARVAPHRQSSTISTSSIEMPELPTLRLVLYWTSFLFISICHNVEKSDMLRYTKALHSSMLMQNIIRKLVTQLTGGYTRRGDGQYAYHSADKFWDILYQSSPPGMSRIPPVATMYFSERLMLTSRVLEELICFCHDIVSKSSQLPTPQAYTFGIQVATVLFPACLIAWSACLMTDNSTWLDMQTRLASTADTTRFNCLARLTKRVVAVWASLPDGLLVRDVLKEQFEAGSLYHFIQFRLSATQIHHQHQTELYSLLSMKCRESDKHLKPHSSASQTILRLKQNLSSLFATSGMSGSPEGLLRNLHKSAQFSPFTTDEGVRPPALSIATEQANLLLLFARIAIFLQRSTSKGTGAPISTTTDCTLTDVVENTLRRANLSAPSPRCFSPPAIEPGVLDGVSPNPFQCLLQMTANIPGVCNCVALLVLLLRGFVDSSSTNSNVRAGDATGCSSREPDISQRVCYFSIEDSNYCDNNKRSLWHFGSSWVRRNISRLVPQISREDHQFIDEDIPLELALHCLQIFSANRQSILQNIQLCKTQSTEIMPCLTIRATASCPLFHLSAFFSKPFGTDSGRPTHRDQETFLLPLLSSVSASLDLLTICMLLCIARLFRETNLSSHSLECRVDLVPQCEKASRHHSKTLPPYYSTAKIITTVTVLPVRQVSSYGSGVFLGQECPVVGVAHVTELLLNLLGQEVERDFDLSEECTHSGLILYRSILFIAASFGLESLQKEAQSTWLTSHFALRLTRLVVRTNKVFAFRLQCLYLDSTRLSAVIQPVQPEYRPTAQERNRMALLQTSLNKHAELESALSVAEPTFAVGIFSSLCVFLSAAAEVEPLLREHLNPDYRSNSRRKKTEEATTGCFAALSHAVFALLPSFTSDVSIEFGPLQSPAPPSSSSRHPSRSPPPALCPSWLEQARTAKGYSAGGSGLVVLQSNQSIERGSSYPRDMGEFPSPLKQDNNGRQFSAYSFRPFERGKCPSDAELILSELSIRDRRSNFKISVDLHKTKYKVYPWLVQMSIRAAYRASEPRNRTTFTARVFSRLSLWAASVGYIQTIVISSIVMEEILRETKRTRHLSEKLNEELLSTISVLIVTLQDSEEMASPTTRVQNLNRKLTIISARAKTSPFKSSSISYEKIAQNTSPELLLIRLSLISQAVSLKRLAVTVARLLSISIAQISEPQIVMSATPFRQESRTLNRARALANSLAEQLTTEVMSIDCRLQKFLASRQCFRELGDDVSILVWALLTSVIEAIQVLLNGTMTRQKLLSPQEGVVSSGSSPSSSNSLCDGLIHTSPAISTNVAVSDSSAVCRMLTDRNEGSPRDEKPGRHLITSTFFDGEPRRRSRKADLPPASVGRCTDTLSADSLKESRTSGGVMLLHVNRSNSSPPTASSFVQNTGEDKVALTKDARGIREVPLVHMLASSSSRPPKSNLEPSRRTKMGVAAAESTMACHPRSPSGSMPPFPQQQSERTLFRHSQDDSKEAERTHHGNNHLTGASLRSMSVHHASTVADSSCPATARFKSKPYRKLVPELITRDVNIASAVAMGIEHRQQNEHRRLAHVEMDKHRKQRNEDDVSACPKTLGRRQKSRWSRARLGDVTEALTSSSSSSESGKVYDDVPTSEQVTSVDEDELDWIDFESTEDGCLFVESNVSNNNGYTSTGRSGTETSANYRQHDVLEELNRAEVAPHWKTFIEGMFCSADGAHAARRLGEFGRQSSLLDNMK